MENLKIETNKSKKKNLIPLSFNEDANGFTIRFGGENADMYYLIHIHNNDEGAVITELWTSDIGGHTIERLSDRENFSNVTVELRRKNK
jgi:hypothetical protein